MVTMADVARAAGVSKSTVSLALAGSRLLPEATRKKVAEEAARLGYRRDPLLSALSARRCGAGARPHHGTLVLAALAREFKSDRPYVPMIWRGAKAAAAELGYSVEEQAVEEDGAGPRRTAQIWRARGVSGVLWCSWIPEVWIEKFSWDNFSSVTVARSNAGYPIHIVNSDLSGAVMVTWRRICEARYERVAVLLRDSMDLSWGRRISLLWKGLRSDDPGRFCREGIRHYEGLPLKPEVIAWLRSERPCVVVADSEECCRAVAPHLPKGCRLMATGLRRRRPDLTGMYQSTETLAEVAVRKLDAMIRVGERGLAVNRETTLVEGVWVRGRSARANP